LAEVLRFAAKALARFSHSSIFQDFKISRFQDVEGEGETLARPLHRATLLACCEDLMTFPDLSRLAVLDSLTKQDHLQARKSTAFKMHLNGI